MLHSYLYSHAWSVLLPSLRSSNKWVSIYPVSDSQDSTDILLPCSAFKYTRQFPVYPLLKTFLYDKVSIHIKILIELPLLSSLRSGIAFFSDPDPTKFSECESWKTLQTYS